MKRRMVVRVAGFVAKDPLLECLRYAGHVKTHSDKLFDIIAPEGVDSAVWAKMNAERMASFGFNAVAAPQWGINDTVAGWVMEAGLKEEVR